MSCAICLDDDAGKKTMACTACNTGFCQPCMRTYLLTIDKDPACPECHAAFSRPFLKEHLPKSFLAKEYAARRRDLLWDREKALMPEAQAELVKQRTLEPLNVRRAQLIAELNTITQKIYEIQTANTVATTSKCPACKGYLDAEMHCDLGGHSICRDCYKEVAEGHKCDEADVATVKELVRDCKPCPKCGVFIGRESGCDNMFCVDCKTAFNWRTMRIQEGGYIDNPHYFEYARANNIALARIDEPVLPDYDLIRNLVSWDRELASSNEPASEESPEFLAAFRIRKSLGELHRARQRLYNSHNRPPSTLHLRVQYLSDTISEERVKQRLYAIERRQQRDRAVSDIIDKTIRDVSRVYDHFRESSESAVIAIVPDYQPAQTTLNRLSFWMSNPKQARLIFNVYCQEWNKHAVDIPRIVEEANEALQRVESGFDCRTLRVELMPPSPAS